MNIGITQKFLVPIFAVLMLLGAILTYQVNSILRQEAIEGSKNIVADFVNIQTRKHTSPTDFSLTDSNQTDQVFTTLLEEIKTSDLIRIKVWNTDGTIIFSDDKSIIGKNFRESAYFQKAIGGEVVADVKTPLDAEHAAEKGYTQLMEVYVPTEFKTGDGVIGIVETYYKLDSLNTSLFKAQSEIFLIIISSFLFLALVLWLLIKFVVIKPLQMLETGIVGLRERKED
jgi:hypothetical protein